MIPIKDFEDFNQAINTCLDEIKQRLITKHEAYGDIENFTTVFSRSTVIGRLEISVDDKLNRVRNQQNDEDEDVEMDLIGYLVLLKIAKRNAAKYV